MWFFCLELLRFFHGICEQRSGVGEGVNAETNWTVFAALVESRKRGREGRERHKYINSNNLQLVFLDIL